MKIEFSEGALSELRAPLLAVPVAEGGAQSGTFREVSELLGGLPERLLRSGDFRGKRDQEQLLFPAGGGGIERVLLVGIGKLEELDAETLRRAGGTAAKAAARLRVDRLTSLLHLGAPPSRVSAEAAVAATVEGLVLGAYLFEEMRQTAEEPPVELGQVTLHLGEGSAEPLRQAAGRGEVTARGENVARTLGNLPGNVATPSYLADRAWKIAGETGMRCTVLDRPALESEGMGALLAVSRGSAEDPRLIVLEHRGGGERDGPVVLIGKGLTFDSGGISIKPALGMEEMKFDMCGGAAVLGAMQAVAELQLPLNVVGIVPASENLPSGAALKPGDIIRSHLGKSIEIINTDAEGRLILADALSYARRFSPAAVVDVATLTGACVIALGSHSCAVMGSDEQLVEELRRAGERTGERAWPLPMHREYREALDSDYADIKNSGGRPAGTITAGWFLREFVDGFPWAHLDIAGVAWGEGKLPYQRKGATGSPTRLLVDWVAARAG
jgi:leucyl aminopeptidase